jgi:hypothetical protein
VPLDRFDIVDGFAARSAREVFAYAGEWGLPTRDERAEIARMMGRESRAGERSGVRGAAEGAA